MKPSTRTTLDTLEPGRWVTTHDLLMAGCGSRYSARIMELRHLGYEIEAEQVRPGSWRYRRSAGPESAPAATLTPSPYSGRGLGVWPAGEAPARPTPLPAGVIPVRAHSRRVHQPEADAQLVLAI